MFSDAQDETQSANVVTLPAKSVLGVVLAGGQSSRMGSDKALLLHSTGHTYLQHAIERLLPLTSLVAVSGRTSPDSRALSIPDQYSGQGPAIAVWSTVQFAKEHNCEGVLVTPVDMPLLDATHLQQILKASAGYDLTCASLDRSGLHPLIAYYPVQLEESLRAEAMSERRSLRAWFERQTFHRVSLAEDLLVDVNTPQDFEQTKFCAP